MYISKNKMYFLLITFLILGLFTGYIQSNIELENSINRIPNKSILNYWLGK
jgi:hypothetical protein